MSLHILKTVSLCHKLFKEMFKMSSAAAQKASMKSFQIFSTFAVVDPTQPNLPKTEKSRPNPTQPMGQPNQWTTLFVQRRINSIHLTAICIYLTHRASSSRTSVQLNFHLLRVNQQSFPVSLLSSSSQRIR